MDIPNHPKEIRIPCPFHNGRDKESLVIDVRSQRGTCFSECGEAYCKVIGRGLVGPNVIDLCVWIHVMIKKDGIDSRQKAEQYLREVVLPDLPRQDQPKIEKHESKTIAHDTLSSSLPCSKNKKEQPQSQFDPRQER